MKYADRSTLVLSRKYEHSFKNRVFREWMNFCEDGYVWFGGSIVIESNSSKDIIDQILNLQPLRAHVTFTTENGVTKGCITLVPQRIVERWDNGCFNTIVTMVGGDNITGLLMMEQEYCNASLIFANKRRY